MFWPSLAPDLIRRRHDGQPLVSQEYSLPKPQYNEFRDHDIAIFSVWNHFIRFCLKTADRVFEEDSSSQYNQISGKPRLRIFMQLSSSNSSLTELASHYDGKSLVLSPGSSFRVVNDVYRGSPIQSSPSRSIIRSHNHSPLMQQSKQMDYPTSDKTTGFSVWRDQEAISSSTEELAASLIHIARPRDEGYQRHIKAAYSEGERYYSQNRSFNDSHFAEEMSQWQREGASYQLDCNGISSCSSGGMSSYELKSYQSFW
jgi:hypothetical protein